MSKLIGLLVLLLFASNLNAQDSLHFNRSNRTILQNGEVLGKVELASTVRPNKEAFKHLQAATDSRIFSNVLLIIGGFPLGYSIGYWLVTQEIPPIMFGTGLGLYAGGIILNIRSKNQYQKTVDTYNADLNLSTFHHKTPLELRLGVNQYGVGLGFAF